MTFADGSYGGDLLQVVVLRVSLHCKGCEGKVRKHISRMEGKVEEYDQLVLQIILLS